MFIGIDVGGSHIGAGIINNEGEILEKQEKDIEIYKSKNKNKLLSDTIIELIKNLTEKIHIKDIQKIGIAIPGIVSDTDIIKAENLGINNFNIVSELKKHFNLEITLRNDAKCAAIAEKTYGSLKNARDAIFLVLGTGIGGAVFLDNKILRPKKNEGFEIGHMVIEKNGIQCNCGKRGCFERYASIKSLKTKICDEYNLENMSGVEIKKFIKGKQEDKKMNKILDKYIKDLALGITNLIDIFEPEVISIGGSFSFYKDILLDRLKEELKNMPKISCSTVPYIVVAELKNDAGIIGAGL